MINREEIVETGKDFASAFADSIGGIAGSGWLIVDPLSGFLNMAGVKNTLQELPASDKHPQVLVMTFEDGSQLIPAGSDLKGVFPNATDWMWL